MDDIQVETLPAAAIPQTQSGTIVASWVGMAFMAIGLLGVVVKPETQQAWTDLIVQAAPLVGGLVAFGVAWWRRYRSVAPIVGGPGDAQVMAQKQATEQARAILRSE